MLLTFLNWFFRSFSSLFFSFNIFDIVSHKFDEIIHWNTQTKLIFLNFYIEKLFLTNTGLKKYYKNIYVNIRKVEIKNFSYIRIFFYNNNVNTKNWSTIEGNRVVTFPGWLVIFSKPFLQIFANWFSKILSTILTSFQFFFKDFMTYPTKFFINLAFLFPILIYLLQM